MTKQADFSGPFIAVAISKYNLFFWLRNSTQNKKARTSLAFLLLNTKNYLAVSFSTFSSPNLPLTWHLLCLHFVLL